MDEDKILEALTELKTDNVWIKKAISNCIAHQERYIYLLIITLAAAVGGLFLALMG